MASDSDWTRILRGFKNPGKSKETHVTFEVAHAELARLRQIESRNDDSEEVKKARRDILMFTAVLDGESGILEYIISLRDTARHSASDPHPNQ